MRIFAFDPADYRDEYASQGWIHIRGGVDPEFLDTLREFVDRREQHRVEGAAIGGRKDQALYDFPLESDFPSELFDVVAGVCALNRATMTLSERHLKAYDHDAPPNVPAHKDRFASQVSVGLSIDIPVESKLLLYPNDDLWPNPYNVSSALREALEPDELPEAVLRDADPVEIDDAAGDVMMFPGSAVWHVRRNQASARNLYLKFNDFDCDPLGEDPNTAVRREATLHALSLSDEEFVSHVPVPSRRLDTLTRQYSRGDGPEVVQAHVWEEQPVVLSEHELAALRAAGYETSVSETAARLGSNGRAPAAVTADIRRLARRAVIDLLPPG